MFARGQHFVAFLNAVCSDDNKSCASYLLGEYVVRSVVMLAIIVAVNFNITVRSADRCSTAY